MNLSNDDIRRDLRAINQVQEAAVRDSGALLDAVLSGDARLSSPERADVLLGGLGRRRFLRLGGFSVATAAVIAACGGSESGGIPQAGLVPTTLGLPERVIDDIVLLRTASSLEYTAIDAYTKAIDSGALNEVQASIAKLFRNHHGEHAAFFDAATKSAGGEAFTKANPVLAESVLKPVLELIGVSKDPQGDLMRFAHGLENLAAGTYQQLVASLTKPTLRQKAMTVGSVEARHAAILAKALGGEPVVGLITPSTASTTVAAATNGPAAVVIPVYQVPGAFGSLAATSIVLNGTKVDVDIPGPNSFMYYEVKKP